MYQDDPGLEQRLSRFEAQLDRFSLALQQWQRQDHAHAAGAPEIDQRLRALEETFGREAQALRQMHEEPLRQLQAQAQNLEQLCAAATSSVSTLEQAEARLAELQGSVSALVGDLSRSLQTLMSDMRIGAPALSGHGSAAAWPLERVVHLHDELRKSGNGGARAASPLGLPGAAEQPAINAVPIEPEPPSRLREAFQDPKWRYLAGAAVVSAVLLTAYLASRIDARLDDAAARVEAAERQVAATTELANREVLAARRDADRQISEARQLAQRAETVGAILTAPDLVRFNLTSADAGGASAQLLWSRTRGLVLSGSRLPAAPPDTTYQLWLVTGAQWFGAGVFVPDSSGRASLVVDEPPRVAGRVFGAAVTVEPAGGRPAPSGRTLLARLPVASPPEAAPSEPSAQP